MSDRFPLAIVGAGNFAITTQVMVTLADFDAVPLDIRLYDPHEERLDLIDRFTRVALEIMEVEHQVRATTDWNEAITLVRSVVLALDETAARRMKGTRLELAPPDDWGPSGFDEIHGGDPNRPTPIENLSPHIQALLEQPVDRDTPAAQLIQESTTEILRGLPEGIIVLNLMRSHPLPDGYPHTYLNWPAQLDEDTEARLPHQMMRWAMQTEDFSALRKAAQSNAFRDWLDGVTRA